MLFAKRSRYSLRVSRSVIFQQFVLNGQKYNWKCKYQPELAHLYRAFQHPKFHKKDMYLVELFNELEENLRSKWYSSDVYIFIERIP